MSAAHQTTREKTRKSLQKTREKKTQKKRKNPQILKSRCFRWFLDFFAVPKIITVCVPGRSAEIFRRNIHV